MRCKLGGASVPTWVTCTYKVFLGAPSRPGGSLTSLRRWFVFGALGRFQISRTHGVEHGSTCGSNIVDGQTHLEFRGSHTTIRASTSLTSLQWRRWSISLSFAAFSSSEELLAIMEPAPKKMKPPLVSLVVGPGTSSPDGDQLNRLKLVPHVWVCPPRSLR